MGRTAICSTRSHTWDPRTSSGHSKPVEEIMLAAQQMPLVGYQPQILKRVEVGSVTKRLLGIPIERISESQTRGEGRGRRDRAARAKCRKSQELHTVAETGTGRGGGAVCEARVVTGSSPRLRRVRHPHAVTGRARDVRVAMPPCLLTPPS